MAKNQAFTQSDDEIAQLIQEVRQEVSTLLKSETPALKKSETSPSSSAAETSFAKDEFPPADAGSSSGSASDGAAPSAPAPDAGSASSSGSPSESSSSSSSSGSSSGSSSDSHSDEGTSPDQLQQAYEQLSPEEQLMHLQALKAAIMKHGGGDQSAAPAPQGPPPAAPGADAGMPGEGSQPVAPAFKSEAKDKEIETLKKRAADAEAKFKAMATQTEDLEKSVTLLTGAFETMLTKPMRKSVTAQNFVPDVTAQAVDPAKLTKSEITKVLTDASKRPDLKKSDRDLINSFYNGKAKIADLGHFFK